MNIFGSLKASFLFTGILVCSTVIASDEVSRTKQLEDKILEVSSRENGNYLSIEPQEGDDMIEVWIGSDHNSPLHLMIGTYPLSEDPEEVFAQRNISLPDGWRITRWEKKVFAQFEGSVKNTSAIASWIDEIMIKLLNYPSNYEIVIGLGKL